MLIIVSKIILLYYLFNLCYTLGLLVLFIYRFIISIIKNVLFTV